MSKTIGELREGRIVRRKRTPKERIEKLATAISDLMFDEGMHHTSVLITEDRFDVLSADRGVPMCRYSGSDGAEDTPIAGTTKEKTLSEAVRRVSEASAKLRTLEETEPKIYLDIKASAASQEKAEKVLTLVKQLESEGYAVTYALHSSAGLEVSTPGTEIHYPDFD